jgi:hypothetical protein
MTTLSNLISALIVVESSGNDQAIGDGGKAGRGRAWLGMARQGTATTLSGVR